MKVKLSQVLYGCPGSLLIKHLSQPLIINMLPSSVSYCDMQMLLRIS